MSRPEIIRDSELRFDSELVFTLNGVPFTGIAYEESTELGRSEISYEKGIQQGQARDWYPNGALKWEANFQGGTLHGVKREYDSAGCLLLEAVYEYGIQLSWKQFNVDEVVSEGALDPTSDVAELLARLRKERDRRR